jgi:FMN phosphatase YigB (HAD superfamily)
MIIAIDIDNTLFTCNSIVYKVLNKIQKVGKPNAKNLTYKTVTPDGKTNQSFLRLLFPMLNAKKFTALEGALETLTEWKKEGHEIVLLTNRPAKIKAMKNATLALLEYHNVSYDKLVMGCKNKHLFCKQFGIPLLIDDNEKNCTNANSKGITSIRIGKQNKDNNPQGISFNVDSWKTVKFYAEIVQYNNIVRPPHIMEGLESTRERLMRNLIDSKRTFNNYDEIITSPTYDPEKFLETSPKNKDDLKHQFEEIITRNQLSDKKLPVIAENEVITDLTAPLIVSALSVKNNNGNEKK